MKNRLLKIRKTIGLLNSMIKSGEQYTVTSEKQVAEALDAIGKLNKDFEEDALCRAGIHPTDWNGVCFKCGQTQYKGTIII